MNIYHVERYNSYYFLPFPRLLAFLGHYSRVRSSASLSPVPTCSFLSHLHPECGRAPSPTAFPALVCRWAVLPLAASYPTQSISSELGLHSL
jgi:hypothetical protein